MLGNAKKSCNVTRYSQAERDCPNNRKTIQINVRLSYIWFYIRIDPHWNKKNSWSITYDRSTSSTAVLQGWETQLMPTASIENHQMDGWKHFAINGPNGMAEHLQCHARTWSTQTYWWRLYHALVWNFSKVVLELRNEN